MSNLSIFDFEPSKITSRARFFTEIEPHLPIEDWMRIMKPIYYPDAHKGGNQPKPLEIMIRTYLVQNFFSLSDEGCEDAVYDSLSVRKFVGISTNEGDIPEKSTICRFRNLLIEHGIQQKLFDNVVSSLAAKGLIVKKGTIVDSTIIENSTSKRNKDKARDPESSFSMFAAQTRPLAARLLAGTRTKKGGNFKHGFKSHIGTDADSGLVTSNITTAAKVHDVTQGNKLLHGDEEAVYGDSGFLNLENHPHALALRKYHIMLRPSMIKRLPESEQETAHRRQQAIATVRAKVEHAFGTLKHLFGFRYTRYRGLKKNAAKLNMMYALTNIWKVSRMSQKMPLLT